MPKSERVQCLSHGWQEEAFVCQHIAGSLRTGVPVGFHWPAGSTTAHPDAWCTECEESRLAAGGDWTPQVEADLGIQLLCATCYERAKDIWSRGYKVSQ
jgi:hypothetical protein